MGDIGRGERVRLWLAGLMFTLAGRIHESYDVWLDTATPRSEDPDGTAFENDPEYMCPNCVTPWKCNGPHSFPETA